MYYLYYYITYEYCLITFFIFPSKYINLLYMRSELSTFILLCFEESGDINRSGMISTSALDLMQSIETLLFSNRICLFLLLSNNI